MLIHEAIGDQLTCIFVDHGLMRLNEAEEVVALFRGHYNIPLVHVDASETFLSALDGVADPEAKRKTIGRLFIETFEAEAEKIGGADFLAQGTLYPDVIESVSFTGGPSVTIKSHHNVGGLPERMNMKLVEPLRTCLEQPGLAEVIEKLFASFANFGTVKAFRQMRQTRLDPPPLETDIRLPAYSVHRQRGS